MVQHDSNAGKAKKSNLFLRLLALLVTAALVLGALVLVVYRDRFNLDALVRWLAYRDLETSDTGEAAPFTHAGGDRMSIAYLDGGVLTASVAGAHYYSLSGEPYVEEVLPLENPVLTASESAALPPLSSRSSVRPSPAGAEPQPESASSSTRKTTHILRIRAPP